MHIGLEKIVVIFERAEVFICASKFWFSRNTLVPYGNPEYAKNFKNCEFAKVKNTQKTLMPRQPLNVHS
jgi:hypothetical protein